MKVSKIMVFHDHYSCPKCYSRRCHYNPNDGSMFCDDCGYVGVNREFMVKT